MSEKNGLENRGFLAAAAVVSFILLVIDSQIELGVAIGSCYVAVVLMAALTRNRLMPVATAIVSTGFILGGWMLSPDGGEAVKVASNRLISIGCVWVVAGISSKRLRLTAELEASEERHREVLESALDAVVGMDLDGIVTAWNRQAETVFGWPENEVMGRKVSDLIIPDEFRDGHSAGLAYFRKTGEGPVLNARLELEAVRKSGDRFPVELTILPINQHGQQFFTAFVRDISNRRRAEKQIQSMNEELTAKNEELQQFVYTVSHDLKSPLVTLEGFTGVMREELADGNQAEVLACTDRIERATQRMGHLIQDLLELSRVGTVRSDSEPVNVSELVASVRSDLEDRLSKSGAELSIAPDMPFVVADRTRLGQVFENLISNAIKYGSSNEDPRIEVTGLADAEKIQYRVSDNGVGIEAEYHQTVFKPFERLQSDKEGTGMGLAIVRRIVERNGGTVRVSSATTEGTCFLLEFPIELAADVRNSERS